MVLDPQSSNYTTADNEIFRVNGETTHENVQFSDQNDPYAYDIVASTDSVRALNDTNDASLENFFSRPVKIAEREWSTNATQNFNLNPWDLFFDNPRVTNRLTNFSLLKAKMKIKVVINGNGFHYGRMMMSYSPYHIFDTLSSNESVFRPDLIQASQCPHIFLNPTASTGGEMTLPFFNYQNHLKIVDAQWGEMGRLEFRTLNPLKHANGATDVVTITVFAWAEDVEMSVLTSVDTTTLIPQSGEIDKANQTGVVSGPATAVAKFAAYLKGVPYIGPFATATEIGAKAVAGMAKIFGYCRPPITKAPDPYRPTQISSLALTNVPDVLQKLTVDDKQELTIDPRISGIGAADPMNIREIAKRESFLTTFNWNIGVSPDTLLWNSRVSPVTWGEGITPAGFNAHVLPACAFAALPFQYWKGSMKFRFQIVASSFHKGRLRVVYDPNFMSDTRYVTPGGNFAEYNTNYLKIIDIAEEQDFTIEVGGAQEVTFMEHANPGLDSVTEVYSSTRYASKAPGNGVIAVYVVNELTTPSSTVTNDIAINVFVSMGDDFEVAVPTDLFQRFVLAPQSGDLVTEAMGTDEMDAPQQSTSTIIGLPPSDDSNLNKVYFGESIITFRTMLKRYTLWNVIPKLDTIPVISAGRFSNFPYLRGAVDGAVGSTGTVPYNYCNPLLLHWVRSAFSGSRGSIRYKLVPTGTQNIGDRVEVSRSVFYPGGKSYDFSSQAPGNWGTLEAAQKAIMSEPDFGSGDTLPGPDRSFIGATGVALTTNSVNGALEFEVPYYSNNRFTPGKIQNFTGPQLFEGTWDYRAWFMSNEPSSASAALNVYAAAGEDFQVYFFTGMPRLYYEDFPP